jgi:hypothetical protein
MDIKIFILIAWILIGIVNLTFTVTKIDYAMC